MIGTIGVILPFSLYKILFYFRALLWESIIRLFPLPHLQSLPYCNAIARPLRNGRPPHRPPPFYVTHHTILVIAISCKGQYSSSTSTQRTTWSRCPCTSTLAYVHEGSEFTHCGSLVAAGHLERDDLKQNVCVGEERVLVNSPCKDKHHLIMQERDACLHWKWFSRRMYICIYINIYI